MTETAKKMPFAGLIINQRPMCHVCASSDLETIEKEILKGTSYREISMIYGVSEKSIFKHKKNHMARIGGFDE
ncbi:hypothetical protein DSECCO2_99780 [anaerobic digester metagenome]